MFRGDLRFRNLRKPFTRSRAIFSWLILAGVVLVSLSIGRADLKGATASVQTVRGILVAKSDTTIDIRPDGEQRASRYFLIPPGFRPDAKAAAFIQSLVVGSDVQLDWIPVGSRRDMQKIVILAPPGKFGFFAGTVTDIMPNVLTDNHHLAWIEIQDDQGKKEKYSPSWLEKGPDKEMLQAIADRNVGDRVEIRWRADDHVRVTEMRLLAMSPAAATQPGGEGGTVAGRIVEKGKDWVSIKPDSGDPIHYLPQRVIGTKDELDRDVLHGIAAAKVGDRVEIAWFKDGERRIYSWKGPGMPPAKPLATRPAATRPGKT